LIERTIKDGKRAADVVSRIRDFFRKGADAEGKNLEINETILGVIELTRAAMSEKRVMVTMQLAKELPRILGDRVQLQQVILNLMMNAIEAMSEVKQGPRELLINTSQIESGGVLVAVSDSGLGLPPANSGRIFEAFYTSKPSGLGMGLSICRSIVEAHGGRLWAAPNKPRGAILCMTPPIGEKSLENLEPTEASFRLKGELS
jgi:C4-dicarboxylate-specific signal transduction histidine kinase